MTKAGTTEDKTTAKPDRPAGGSTQPPWRWQFVVAAVLIAAFIALVILMLAWANSPDDVWKNRIFVFSSMEAIVFTAVGWTFGREVNRVGAESARKDADEAKDEARSKSNLADQKSAEAAAEHAKGMQLAGAVAALAVPTGTANSSGPSDVGFRKGAVVSPQIEFLQDLVQRLYG